MNPKQRESRINITALVNHDDQSNGSLWRLLEPIPEGFEYILSAGTPKRIHHINSNALQAPDDPLQQDRLLSSKKKTG